MFLDQMLAQVEGFQVSALMRESTWLFPTVETVHVLALTLVIGTIARVDLRLLSILNDKDSVRQVMAGLLPWTWGAFLVAAVSGTLMFSRGQICRKRAPADQVRFAGPGGRQYDAIPNFRTSPCGGMGYWSNSGRG
jgi:hypothetical protein